MKKIYILTINNLIEVGYNCADVEVFAEKADADKRMRELYLDFCNKYGIENPFEEGSMMAQYEEGSFAFVFGEYYLDIFSRSIM